LILFIHNLCIEHFISTVFKGPKSKDSLRQAISDLRERATSLSRQAELTNHQTIQNISEDIQGIKQSFHNTEGSRTDIYVNLYVLYSAHPSLDSKGELLSDSMNGQYYATAEVFPIFLKSERGK
jgi:hypothetical protein